MASNNNNSSSNHRSGGGEDGGDGVTCVGEEPGPCSGSSQNVVKNEQDARRRVLAAQRAHSASRNLEASKELSEATEQLRRATEELRSAGSAVVQAGGCNAFVAKKLLALLNGDVKAATAIAAFSQRQAAQDDDRLCDAVAFCSTLRGELSSGERADFGQSSLCDMQLLLRRVILLLVERSKLARELKSARIVVALHRTPVPDRIMINNFEERATVNGSWFGTGIYLSFYDKFTRYGLYCVISLVLVGHADRLTHALNANQPVNTPGYGNKTEAGSLDGQFDPTQTELVMPFAMADPRIVPLGFVEGFGPTAETFATVASTAASSCFPQDDHPDSTRFGFTAHAHTFDPATASAWCVDDDTSSQGAGGGGGGGGAGSGGSGTTATSAARASAARASARGGGGSGTTTSAASAASAKVPSKKQKSANQTADQTATTAATHVGTDKKRVRRSAGRK